MGLRGCSLHGASKTRGKAMAQEGKAKERSKQNQQNQGRSKKVRTEIPPSREMSPPSLGKRPR